MSTADLRPALPAPVRIAAFINGLPRGGAETQLLRVLRALSAAGHEVRLFVLKPDNDFAGELGELRVELLSERIGPRSLLNAVRELRAWRPTVVVSFLYQATLLARITATLARVPVVVSSMRNEKLETRLRAVLYRLTGVVDSVTVTNSERAGRALVASRTVDPDKLHIIPNGLSAPVADPVARARLRRELGAGDGTFLFLGVGRLSAQKDWANLVQAVRHYTGPPAVWAIAGTGALEEQLRTQIADAGVGERIRLLGLRSDVADLLSAGDALVLASHYEGMPNVVLEAMATGRPVVATRVGACADLLGEGSTQPGGLLVEPRDPQALAQAMSELAGAPPEIRSAMSARNARVVGAEYSLEVADRRWVELIDGLLGRAGGSTPGSGLRVEVFMPTLDGGGAERVTLSLCSALQQRGHDVGLVLAEARGSLKDDVPVGLPVVDLHRPRVVTSAAALRRHLRRTRPAVLVSVLTHANVVATVVTKVVRPRVRLIVMHHNTMSLSARNSANRRERLMPLLSGLAYRAADAIVAVSEGVADDLAAETGIARTRIQVLPNPIEYERIAALAQQPLPPGLVPPGDGPLLLAAGRLTRQKNFALLLDAFAKLPADFRLALLGDGERRDELQAQAAALGVADRVVFGGFVANPYPVFRAADVYVMSSDWEGLPTVLLESLFFDIAVVSTDCRSGPRQILAAGGHGTLVPVGNAGALAAAVERAGRGPRPVAGQRWRQYDIGVVSEQLDELIRRVAAG